MSVAPPYTLTLRANDYLARIIEEVAFLESETLFTDNRDLQHKNRLKAIHGSVGIEGNTLNLEEVADVIEEKEVEGSLREVLEVKNAYAAYEQLVSFDPYSVKDFLAAHKLITAGLVDEAGMFRSGNVGVFAGSEMIHLGANPRYVPSLVSELFDWAKESEVHPLFKSAIVHYEIETIHPFADGNGRIGRLWHMVILSQVNPIFAWIPMEAVLFKHRSGYYHAIQSSQDLNDSAPFIEFTLSTLLESLDNQ